VNFSFEKRCEMGKIPIYVCPVCGKQHASVAEVTTCCLGKAEKVQAYQCICCWKVYAEEGQAAFCCMSRISILTECELCGELVGNFCGVYGHVCPPK
jgi:hypothetical protein